MVGEVAEGAGEAVFNPLMIKGKVRDGGGRGDAGEGEAVAAGDGEEGGFVRGG